MKIKSKKSKFTPKHELYISKIYSRATKHKIKHVNQFIYLIMFIQLSAYNKIQHVKLKKGRNQIVILNMNRIQGYIRKIKHKQSGSQVRSI